MDAEVQKIKDAYEEFNKRNIDGVLKFLDPEVDWPNGMEGGVEHGHEAVRQYWTRQWQQFDPHVEPLKIEDLSAHKYDVTVHQVVKDIQGKVLADEEIHHLYYFVEGVIIRMEILPK